MEHMQHAMVGDTRWSGREVTKVFFYLSPHRLPCLQQVSSYLPQLFSCHVGEEAVENQSGKREQDFGMCHCNPLPPTPACSPPWTAHDPPCSTSPLLLIYQRQHRTKEAWWFKVNHMWPLAICPGGHNTTENFCTVVSGLVLSDCRIHQKIHFGWERNNRERDVEGGTMPVGWI